MNNPYESPNSELATNLEAENYKSLRWKILFLLLLPLEIWSQYETFTVNEYGDSLLWRICSLFVYMLFFAGLFGLAFKRLYFTRKLWLYFLPVLMSFDCIELFTLLKHTPSEDMGVTIGVFVVISPLIFITWYSVFKYSRVIESELNKSCNSDTVVSAGY